MLADSKKSITFAHRNSGKHRYNAQVAEYVDAHVSGACAARRAGSIPVLGTETPADESLAGVCFYRLHRKARQHAAAIFQQPSLHTRANGRLLRRRPLQRGPSEDVRRIRILNLTDLQKQKFIPIFVYGSRLHIHGVPFPDQTVEPKPHFEKAAHLSCLPAHSRTPLAEDALRKSEGEVSSNPPV